MQPKRLRLTPNGIVELQSELDELKNTKRPKLVDRLSHAREQGDLSENSDYIAAKEELSFMDDRIAELEEVLSTAQVVKTTSKGTVGIGSQVSIKVASRKTPITYHIVGDMEADPKENKISLSSPIGAALAGKKPGETALVQAPAGKVEYQILSIE